MHGNPFYKPLFDVRLSVEISGVKNGHCLVYFSEIMSKRQIEETKQEPHSAVPVPSKMGGTGHNVNFRRRKEWVKFD